MFSPLLASSNNVTTYKSLILLFYVLRVAFSSTSSQFSPRNFARHTARVHRVGERKKSKKNQNRTNRKKNEIRMTLGVSFSLEKSNRKCNRKFPDYSSHHEWPTRIYGGKLHRQINRTIHTLFLFRSGPNRKRRTPAKNFTIRSVP